MLRYKGFHGADIQAPPSEDFVSRDTGKIYKVVFICEGTREREAWWVSTEAKAHHAVWCHTHSYRGKLLPAYKLHESRVIIKEIFKSTD
jgi:hypothetical protein